MTVGCLTQINSLNKTKSLYRECFITGNPHITFFKTVYKRHTSFATSCIEVNFNQKPELGSCVTANIRNIGVLVSKMWLEFEVSNQDNEAVCYGLGNAMVKKVEIEIGGLLIDRH